MYKTLWDRCFWEVFQKMKERGADSIHFADVDRLVLETSHLTIQELVNYLGLTNEDLLNLRQ